MKLTTESQKKPGVRPARTTPPPSGDAASARGRLDARRTLAPGLGTAAFSMIEIAIALGVIGFALVAIVGILPLGLTVQRDNRAETIINQDATYWVEAIRNGAQGIDDLTNYVALIRVEDDMGNGTKHSFAGLEPNTMPYFYGSNIISLLTQPNFSNPTITNAIAYVRSISGAAGEKGSNVAFKYQMKVQTISINNPSVSANFGTPLPTLYEVRLEFSWPVIHGNDPPKTSRPPLLYRTLISRNVATNYLNDVIGGAEFYHFTL